MSIPFVVGQWVRGVRFYGRARLIEEIMSGPRDSLWVVGLRRIGKTSLLKHIEQLAGASDRSEYFPLFWDFQDAQSVSDFHLGFRDALEDAEERLEHAGIRLDEISHDDLFRSLKKFRRRLRTKKLKLLLLCDEAERLITLSEEDPGLLGKLRKALQAESDVRAVLTSTIRLWALADERGDTSPFLHGFTPPLYIRTMRDNDARALIRQVNLPDDSRPRLDEDAVEIIRQRCDNHPYLVQTLCKNYVEVGDIEDATEQVAADPMLRHFLEIDFEMLSDMKQNILRVIAEHDSSTSNSIQKDMTVDMNDLAGHLLGLERLGYIRRTPERRYVLANYFFRRWVRELLALISHPIDRSKAGETTVEDESGTGLFDDRYDLLGRVGRGATGEVYRAWDTELRVNVAIKLLRAEYTAHEECLERLRREVVLSRDISHPNIITIYHLGDCEGRKYLTMRWMDGTTLAETIRDKAPLAIERAVDLTRKLADALGAAHACGVIHRDIKPQNILIDADGEPYLTDFGLARLIDGPGMTHQKAFLGTPNYAAPEQADRRPLDERSDIHALGIILFEMLTGVRPFKGDTADLVLEQIRTLPAPDPRELRPEVPEELALVVLRCLEKKPAQRFRTAATFRAALRAPSPSA